MRLRYTQAAAQELADLLDYVRQRSPKGATAVLDRIQDIEALIRDFPESGRPVRFGLRQVTTPPYPYVIFYEATATDVVIHRIRHRARKPWVPDEH